MSDGKLHIKFYHPNDPKVVGELFWHEDRAPPSVLIDQFGTHWHFWNMANGAVNYILIDDPVSMEVNITFSP